MPLPSHIEQLLDALTKVEKSKVEQFTALLAASPDRFFGGLIQLLALKPAPVFTKPTVYTQPLGDVTIALRANLHHAPKYSLLVFKNEMPVSPPTHVKKNGVDVPSTQIEISGSPAVSGDLVIPAAYFTPLGPGNYLFRIQANSLFSTAGYGVTIYEIELT